MKVSKNREVKLFKCKESHSSVGCRSKKHVKIRPLMSCCNRNLFVYTLGLDAHFWHSEFFAFILYGISTADRKLKLLSLETKKIHCDKLDSHFRCIQAFEINLASILASVAFHKKNVINFTIFESFEDLYQPPKIRIRGLKLTKI